MSETGKLSEKVKYLVMDNMRELSAVEANIVSSNVEREIKTIIITSCHDLEGKTVSSISIAYVLSKEANAKVLLIDGNLHAPNLFELFNLDSSPGLSDLILSNSQYDDVLRDTEYDNLIIMPHGDKVINSLDVFKSKSFKEHIDLLKQRFDYIILDGPTVLGSSDVSVLAKYFDGVIIVVECERTRWEVLQLAKERINNVRGNIIGAVLNKRKYYIPKVLYGNV